MKCFFIVLFLTAAFLLPSAAFAHGVEIYDETGRAGARTVRFMYSTGEAMLFAPVKVYSPSAPDATIQESMTDRDGYFSFVPFEDGPWRLAVEDGMGHRGEVTLTITRSGADQGNDAAATTVAGAAGTVPGPLPLALLPGALPLAVRILLGLSLILNIFAVYNFILRRGAKTPGPEAGIKKGGGHAYQ
jgi:nickel transport protein